MGLTYFITGATRGLGFEFARQLSEDADNKVIASSRSLKSSGQLQKLADSRKNVFIVELEVGDESSAIALPEQLARIDSGIDVLIHNAGIALPESSDATLNIRRETWLKQYKVNVLGAIEVFQKVYPFLVKRDTRKVIFLSSIAGSFSEFIPMPLGPYGQSKAALNYTIKHIATELESEKFTVIATHPGLVTTDTGNAAIGKLEEVVTDQQALEEVKNSAITPKVSVEGLLNVVKTITVEDTGKFYYYDGSVHDF